MKSAALAPKIIFAGGVLLGYFFLPLSSYFGGSYDLRATVGGITGLVVGVVLLIKVLQSKQVPLSHLLIGVAMGLLIASFWAQQQIQHGYVDYAQRGGSSTRVDWHRHPAVAFHTITWGAIAFPTLFFYAKAKLKKT